LAHGYLGVNQFFGPRDRNKMLGSTMHMDLGPELKKLRSCSAAQGIPGMYMAADFRTYLCDDILTKVDRVSMMNSLEVRAPFLGKDIINFAYKETPNSFRVARGRRKVLLKHLAKRILPSTLDIERKQGFSIPISTWLAGTWGAVIFQLLREIPTWLLTQNEIEQLIAGQQAGRKNGERIFALAMLEIWRRENAISEPSI
jgi:asparagine synthase (glutamine-hydrolysing)